jgi:hypothetical protein
MWNQRVWYLQLFLKTALAIWGPLWIYFNIWDYFFYFCHKYLGNFYGDWTESVDCFVCMNISIISYSNTWIWANVSLYFNFPSVSFFSYLNHISNTQSIYLYRKWSLLSQSNLTNINISTPDIPKFFMSKPTHT